MKKYKNNILLFNDILSTGGVERILSYISMNCFVDSNKSILVFDAGKIDFPYEGEIIDLKLSPPPYNNLIKEIFILTKCIIKVRKIKKEKKISLCISHKEGPNFVNILSGISKTIVTVHEYKSTGLRFHGFMNWVVKSIIKKPLKTFYFDYISFTQIIFLFIFF